MVVVDRFPHEVKELENVWIPMPDGCRLAARIWLPIDAEQRPVPAILEYLPYRKRDGTAVRDQLTHPFFAGHGYAAVRVDMRGNGESEGLMFDEYAPQEQDDAVAVIEWLAAQVWCTGKVGMVGISWGGFNGLQVAARRPEPLRAIVTLCSTDDRYEDDIHFKGGCVINENLGWGGTMLSYSSRPPDPELVGERWREMWMERLENLPFFAAQWLRHPHRDAYWKHGSVCEDFSPIEAAVLAVGGWNDAYSNAVPRLLRGLRSPTRAIIGPWLHKYPHFAVPEPRIGFLQEALRWWDFWLKGEVTRVLRDPAIRYYVIDAYRPQGLPKVLAGRWVADGAWPPPNAELHTLHLTPEGLREKPGSETTLTIASPPTTGLDGGEYCPIWLGPDFPGDQARDDAGSLTFDSGVLGEAIDIVGKPAVDLEVSVDRRVAFVALRLNDVWPDGGITRITYHLFNMTHRDGHEHPAPLEPGKRYRVRIGLDDIAWHMPQGHKLRLAISTQYWPMMWPAPEPVTLTMFTGKSRLEVPIRRAPAGEAPLEMPPAETAPPLRQEELRSPSHSREVSEDAGTVTLTIVDDFGKYRNLEHGLVTGSVGRETHSIRPDDASSARMTTHWTQELERDNWRVRTEAFSEMTSTATEFRLKARIEAYEDEKRVFEKEFDETIPRELN
jgi:predicted acyl esterase